MSATTVTRTCKICGKEYPYCHTITDDKYRWQDVACCREHAAEYFALIAASRNEVTEDSKKVVEPKVETTTKDKANDKVSDVISETIQSEPSVYVTERSLRKKHNKNMDTE